MKKVLCLVIALVLSLTVCAAFADEAVVRQPLMTVQGNAVVTVEADTVSIQLGVRTKDPSLSNAQRENRQLMDSVLTALKNCGVQEDEVMTQNLIMSMIHTVIAKNVRSIMLRIILL